MIDNISPHSIANEIMMKRSLFCGIFIIVEGNSDFRFFKNIFSNKNTKIVISFGKENAIEALNILDKYKLETVIAILDSDFSKLKNETIAKSNLFFTDTHDLETIILNSPALEKVLVEYGSSDKINRYIEKTGSSIRESLLKIGEPIGLLRLISLNEGINLEFNNLNYSKFINKNNLTIDIFILIRNVKINSKKYEINEEDILEKINKYRENNYDLWQICCGHDLIIILSIGLRKVLGSNDAGDVKPDFLEMMLRLSYEYSFFLSTDLYKSLLTWTESKGVDIFIN